MTDWKQIARALAIDETDDKLAQTLEPLPRLEEEFKRLSFRLEPDSGLAVTFTALLEDSAE